MRNYTVIFVAASALLGCSSLSADVVYEDSTFNLSDYDVATSISSDGTLSYSQTITEGNPAPALQVVNTVTGTSSPFVSLSADFLNKSFTWDPETQGPLGQERLFMDIKFTPNDPRLQDTVYRGLIEQGGKLYVTGNVFARENGQWQNTFQFFTQSDYQLTINGLVYGGVYPNFANGAPIEFGFTTSWGTNFPYVGAGSTALFDNLEIDLFRSTATPEPGIFIQTALGLFMLGGLLLHGRFSKAFGHGTGRVFHNGNSAGD